MAKYVNTDKIPYTRIRYEDGFDVEFSPKLVFKDDIDKMPSADVRENIHGEWQITDAYPHNVYCSECHTRFAQTHWTVWEDGSLPRKFCPNCGADMRGETK